MDGVVIRSARREDCQGIRNFIQELADFEKMSDGPKIDAATLEKDGFGDNPLFQSIVAEENGKLIGFTIFYFTYSTWEGKSMFLSDLYVIPDFRNKGIGSSLLDAVAKRTIETQCQRLDFDVFKWNPAVNFYNHRGAVHLTGTEDLQRFRLNSESLKQLAAKSKILEIE